MNPKAIYQSSKDLTGNPGYNRLALYSVGALLAANVLLFLIELLIGHLIQDATGLAALGKRSVLLTIQSGFRLALTLALPFWSYGFTRAAMEMARKGDPTPDMLLTGFRRFWPLLRFTIILTLMATGYTLLGTFLGTILFMLTPIADKAFLSVLPALEQAQSLTSDPAALNAMMEPIMLDLLKQIWPMYLLIAIAICFFLLPWLYQLRLAPYHILDGDKSVLLAMEKSRQEMFGNRFSLFKLDLRWWWYHGLLALCAIPLHIYDFVGGGTVALLVTTLLSLGGQFLVQWQLMARYETSLALAYDALKRPSETDVPEGGTPSPF